MNSPTFHPSKKYIRATIPFHEIDTEIPSDIIIPFFIDYSSSHPFVLFIFQKNADNVLEFIKNDSDNQEDDKPYLTELFCNFYLENSTVTHRHSCFYELYNTMPMDLAGSFCNNDTQLWFTTTYEIYNLKTLYDYTIHNDIISFFNSNPCLNQLMWNNTIIPSPIIAYSVDTFQKSKFQSTFGSNRMEDEPYYLLCNYESIPVHIELLRNIHNSFLGIVRYAVFEPISSNIQNEFISYSFSEHTQHTPLCYLKVT